MWLRKPEMPHGSLRERRQGATRKDRGWGMGPSLLEEALRLPGRVAGRGQAGKRLPEQGGLKLLSASPAPAGPAPQTQEGHLFIRAREASCFPTLPLRPASCLASKPIPIPPTFSHYL